MPPELTHDEKVSADLVESLAAAQEVHLLSRPSSARQDVYQVTLRFGTADEASAFADAATETLKALRKGTV